MDTHCTTDKHPQAPFRAVRVWNRPRTKATVVVYDFQGNEVDRAGGKRAERAQAVVLTAWHRWTSADWEAFKADRSYRPADEPKPVGLYGLRADVHAAQVEATRLGESRVTRGGSRTLGGALTVPAAFAVAVLVEEES